MSQLLYGFVEVLRDSRWHVVPEAEVHSVDGGRLLENLLVNLFHHGPEIDEAILQLDTSASELSDAWVDGTHLTQVLREYPGLGSENRQAEAFQLSCATLRRFEWARRLKWLHPLGSEELAKGTFDRSTRTWQPARLEDFLVEDAASIERIAAGDARVADDVARELAAREFPILAGFPTPNRTLWAYETGSGRRAEQGNEYLMYLSYESLLQGCGFLQKLLPTMERAVAAADGQRPEHVRLVYWFE